MVESGQSDLCDGVFTQFNLGNGVSDYSVYKLVRMDDVYGFSQCFLTQHC